MPTTHMDLPLASGVCPTFVVAPDGAGRRPPVVMLTDLFGVRPSILALAERLAREGYVVAVPDYLHATDAGAPLGPPELADEPTRTAWAKRVRPQVRTEDVLADVEAALLHLEVRDDVAPGPAGVVGYCLGGRLALVAAARFAERVRAAAAYHPANLVSDAPDSPHALAARLRGIVYVGAADDDPSLPDAQKEAFARALADAGVRHRVETYAGARHGFVPRDMPAHDEAAAERHWETLSETLRSALGA